MGCDRDGEEDGVCGWRARGGGLGLGRGEDAADVSGREEVGEEAVEEAEVPGEGESFEIEEGKEEKKVAKGEVRSEGGHRERHCGEVEVVGAAGGLNDSLEEL